MILRCNVKLIKSDDMKLGYKLDINIKKFPKIIYITKNKNKNKKLEYNIIKIIEINMNFIYRDI